ncbi:hypothetical protein CHGG_10039 [Chaetomium globosum CBS 148.51]|uniref:HTH CENPB-type domain-containing protein n=1 Tax=Chaetomium globosum (strain ATCC 6205 / CBS 148.51 / DSM 1962 / NBRC 6347 / NRRL 1970) TaxID=306901 RepID=Q2GPR5_CHAGB|nr:uncharacterized protein CHGG_10039 [Chaetomium globosum CBS 148.51]EAQ83635.1 hypothetical protein CHGG_10039 [Chaetomium globosum CBS 148.51]
MVPNSPTDVEQPNWREPAYTAQFPQHLLSVVDHSTWGDLAAIDEIEEPTPKQMNSHIYFLMEIFWASTSYTGRKLWGAFKDEFDEWTVQRWDMVPDRTRKHLRAFLSTNGVYVDNTNIPLPAKFEAIAKRTTFRAWTSDEINSARENSTAFWKRLEDPKFVEDIQELLPWTPTIPAIPAAPTTIPTQPQVPLTTPALPLATPAPQRLPQTTPAPRQQDPIPQMAPAREADWETTPEVKQDPQTWPRPPEELYYAPRGNPRHLADLAEMYNDDMKYGGGDYDVLDVKIAIFRDACNRIGVPRWQASDAFPTMLKDRALQYYYNWLCSGPRDYDAMVAKIRGYFENEEQQHRYLTAWRDARLINMQAEHPDKSKSECLELLINRLALIQRAVPAIGQTEDTLRMQLLNACRGVAEARMALFNPAPTFEGVRNQLQAAIGITTENPGPQQFNTDATDSETFWTDRTGRFHSTFLNDSVPADANQTTTLLANAATHHFLTKEDPFQEQDPSETYTAEGRYSATTFRGIMPDSGAAQFSTAGQPQFQALQRQLPSTTLDTTRAGEAIVKFGYGTPKASLGTTTVPTPLGTIDFHVMETETFGGLRRGDLRTSLEALRSGQIKIIRKAADAFGVPKSTLHRRVKGGGTRQEAQVKNRKLRPTEEAALIQWIESLDDRGMSPTIGYIRQMADLLLRERGGFTLLDASLTSTPVPAMTVGENWVQRLLHRHPHRETKYSRKYDYQRALCEDPEKISAWFARVQRTINEYGVLDSDIYNFDETGFQMGVASTSKVVTRSDRRNRPVVIQPGNREWTTVIECINASGWSVDPMIIFEGKVHISSWYDGSVLPKTWRIGVSDNGWTTR